MVAALTSSHTLADDFAALAERLRQRTVQVRGAHVPGGGSGVIWDAGGTVVTNAHVVARGDRAQVTLWDTREFSGTVTARDAARDLAAITLDGGPHDLPAATIGDSDALRVGELVVAVGNPFGVVGAVTAGIVHAIGPVADGPNGPNGPDSPNRLPWVRADVSLAPGNSGGPLATAAGAVIGINSMIAGGLALAVPANAVTRFLKARTERRYIGVTTQPVLVPVAGGRAFGLLVLEVAPGSPAEAAGILAGDVLVGNGGMPFARPDTLIAALYDADPGAPIRLDLVRAGKRTVRDVTIGRDAPATPPVERAA